MDLTGKTPQEIEIIKGSIKANLTDEEYEATLKEILIEKEYEKRGLKGKTGIDIENMKKYIKAALLADEEFLRTNEYNPSAREEITLGDYGCTLSTVVYIAYSITGKVYSLKEANKLLTEKDVFVDPTDQFGITEKGSLHQYDGSYVKAINTLAEKM